VAAQASRDRTDQNQKDQAAGERMLMAKELEIDQLVDLIEASIFASSTAEEIKGACQIIGIDVEEFRRQLESVYRTILKIDRELYEMAPPPDPVEIERLR